MKSTLLATLALTAVTAAGAQTVTQFPAPMPRPEVGTAQAKAPMRAPLNQNKDKGSFFYATTLVDYDKAYHFLNMWTENNYTLNKMFTVINTDMGDNEDFPSLYQLACGTWAGDAWYGYKQRVYTFETHPDAWVKINPETGSYQKLIDMYNNEYEQKYTTTTSLAWNPQTKDLIALQYSDQTTSNGSVTSRIALVNPATGVAVKVLKELGEFYFGIAFNYDGDLYGIRWTYNNKGEITGTILDVFDSADDYYLIESNPITVDNKAFKPYYQHGLAFDYTTGDLWWAAVDTEAVPYLISINPDTYTTVNKGKIGMEEAITGLYFPYTTADSRTAPARVENMSFTIDPQGADKVTINWTNPTTCWNRTSLKSMEEVLIYRDDVNAAPVGTVAASGMVGKEMSWTDETASQGIHTYYVVPCAVKGEKGIVRSIEAYVGHDVPGPVENLTATTTDGKSINLSWSAPTRGDSDGWFDNSDLEYSIVRMPDNTDLGKTKETSYHDTSLAEAQSYSYIITAISADGVGTPNTSAPLLAGESVVIPFSTIFETKVDADRFTALDVNRDGRTWIYDFNSNLNRQTMRLDCSDYGDDDMLVSPPLKVKKGTSYKVTWNFSVGGYGASDRMYMLHLRSMGGTEPTIDAMTEQLEDFEDYIIKGIYSASELVTYFTAPVDGEYYVGLEQMTNDETEWWMFIEGFSISEAPSTDLEAQTVNAYLNISSTEDNEFTVKVYNNGVTDLTDYKVQVAVKDGDDNKVFAETATVPAIKSHETANVVVSGRPEGYNGPIEIVGIVVADGDGNSDNNVSAPISVNADEYYALNKTVTNASQDINTGVPFNHYTAGYASQTIYTPDMTGFGGQIEPEIYRVALEYEGKDAFGGTEIELYLDQTDKTGFADGDDQWIVPSGNAAFKESNYNTVLGRTYLMMDLDEPWKFDANKPILMTFNKYEAAHNDFLMIFEVFDNNWTMDEFHSLVRKGATKVDVKTSEPAARWPIAPVLHLSFKSKGSGVEEVVVAGEATYFFNSDTNTLRANNSDLTSVDVYDFSGRLVKRVAVAQGQNEVKIDVASGMYILRMNRTNGHAATLKVKAGR